MQRPPDGMKSIIYTGKSMYPLLRDLDRLFYLSCADKEIRVGDVVVIGAPGRKVIHRVLSVNAGGMITGGDNNYIADPWLLDPKWIEGRVDYIRRRNKILPVYGGLLGRAVSAPRRTYRRLIGCILHIMKPSYNMIAKFKLSTVSPVKTRVFEFQCSEGLELQLFAGKRIIGRKKPREVWNIHPIFRLFLDPDALDRSRPGERADINSKI